MGSKTIYDKVQDIKTEKDTKIVSTNIKSGVTIFGVIGSYNGVRVKQQVGLKDI